MCNSEPLRWLDRWYGEAVDAGVYQPDAMALATTSSDGRPSVRMVLLKYYSDDELVFFTSYESRKGQDLAANAAVAATLWWGPQERSVRIEGRAHRVSRERSVDYFDRRPWGSRIAAVASPQSAPMTAAQLLVARDAEVARLAGADPQCPDIWGGYAIVPERVEFWQGKQNRLHERSLFVLTEPGWELTELAP